MTSLAIAWEAFHFLRPLWLILLGAIAVLWVTVRRRRLRPGPVRDGIAPHLRNALTLGARGRTRIVPIDGVALVLALCTLGAAGPTWSRVPDPFVAQTAPLVVVLKVAPSMADPDVAPSRLDRAKQKIRDLLDLRTGARTALIAYAGSAHPVLPMTDDPAVMQPYLDALSPDVMPVDGDDPIAALALARSSLEREVTPGGILLITDGVAPSAADGLTAGPGEGLAVLSMLPPAASDAGLDALDAPVVRVAVDTSDLRALERVLNADYRRALAEDGAQPWNDRGWMLAWPAALLALLWFRRGWTMRWLVVSLAVAVAPSGTVRADGIADWFLTPDQQGRIAYERKTYATAAELFADPVWKGWALYRDGQYGEATEVLGRLDTAQASFLEGMAHIRVRAYRDGIAAFETTLARDPDYPGAAENLATATAILDYVEEARVQSDTGEESGIGADDVVLDNEEARGADTELRGDPAGGTLLSADQWMNIVDTDTRDFLRQRFATEAASQP